MPDEQEPVWPLPKFYFVVYFGVDTQGVPFQEVTGLDTEAQVIEYRNGNSSQSETIKMPGIKKMSNVTLKKGLLDKESPLLNWFAQIKMNQLERMVVTIRLVDDSGNTTMEWKLKNAWPTKILTGELKATGNEVAIETLELAHEGLTVSNS